MNLNIKVTYSKARAIQGRIKKYIRVKFPQKISFLVYRVYSSAQVLNPLSVDFRSVSVDNVIDVKCFRENVYVETFQKQLKQGQIGIFGYYNGDAIAHGWAIINSSKKIMLVNGYFSLPPNSALIHFCNVDSRFRGKKVYQNLLLNLYERLHTYDIYIDTTSSNKPAQKAIVASGGTQIYTISSIFFRNKYLFLKMKETKND